MATKTLEKLLSPIAEDAPAGEELRFDPEWDKLEALRHPGGSKDDDLDKRRDVKWDGIRKLAGRLIEKRSKDVRIGAFYTEALSYLEGFQGVADGLRLMNGMLEQFWDSGLFPASENGDASDRIAALGWFDDKFAELIAGIPFTSRSDGGEDYSLQNLRDARRVGWHRDTLDSSGYAVADKKERFDSAIGSGLISMDMFTEATEACGLERLEELNETFREAAGEFGNFDRLLDEKLEKTAPSLGKAREAWEEIGQQIDGLLSKKRPVEATSDVRADSDPDQPPGPAGARLPAGLDAWTEAESMIRAGQLEEGLAVMTRLANTESRGRSRFQRKLQLAETCMSHKRERLARTILEQLKEQIDDYKLHEWEGPELIGRVWSRLYTIYRKTEPESDRTSELYRRLSHLDPWQVLEIPEE